MKRDSLLCIRWGIKKELRLLAEILKSKCDCPDLNVEERDGLRGLTPVQPVLQARHPMPGGVRGRLDGAWHKKSSEVPSSPNHSFRGCSCVCPPSLPWQCPEQLRETPAQQAQHPWGGNPDSTEARQSSLLLQPDLPELLTR